MREGLQQSTRAPAKRDLTESWCLMHYNRTPTRAIYAVLVALSCGAYSNTLFASFAFDDNFAVVRQVAALLV